MKLRPKTRIDLKTNDDMFLTGSVVKIIEEGTSDFLILDIGEATPIKINMGFIIWIQEKAPARILKFPKLKLIKRSSFR